MPCKPGALSFCMIVKNEERDLPGCLASVRELASELIVGDTGSTDETVRVATENGARVVPFDFAKADFAAARNCTIGQAMGRWILVLDADERLEAGGAGKIEALIAKNENAGYFLERHNHASDSTTAITDHVVRLFPNRAEYRYRGRVHETVDASILAGGGRLIPTDIGIEHRFVSDGDMRRRKNRWYVEILKEEIAADPKDSTRLDFLAAEFHQLEMFNEAAAVMEEIVRMRPRDARARLFLGTYHLLYQRDAARARGDFEKALELKPGYEDALAFLRSMDKES